MLSKIPYTQKQIWPLCHSPRLTQPNLPSQHEKEIRGLSDHELLKRRLEYSGIFNFENSIADSLFLRNTGIGHFLIESDEKHNNQISERQTVGIIEEKTRPLIVTIAHDKTTK